MSYMYQLHDIIMVSQGSPTLEYSAPGVEWKLVLTPALIIALIFVHKLRNWK